MITEAKIDYFADIDTQIKKLEKQRNAIRDELRAHHRETGQRFYPGRFYNVSVTDAPRRALDHKLVRNLYPDVFTECHSESIITTVRLI